MTIPVTAVRAAATGSPQYTAALPRKAASASKARRLVELALLAWGLGALVEDGQLVVSELVANAVEHAEGRRLRVTVTRPAPQRVRLAVIDRSGARPVPRTAAVDDEDGRGLAVIAALATRRGTDILVGGKRSWAELAVRETRCSGLCRWTSARPVEERVVGQ